jgi:CRP-like cAMP-binding protein
MVQVAPLPFDTAAFLANAGLGRKIVQLAPHDSFYCQGDSADSVFYLQKGRARVTVVSAAGKEATITLIQAGEFVGEGALAAVPGMRLSTATAITACTALKIGREEMARVMHTEADFSDLFVKFLLARSIRTQADLVDQLFNSSEKRLAAGRTRDLDSPHHAGDFGGDDRHNAFAGEFLHEPLSGHGIY